MRNLLLSLPFLLVLVHLGVSIPIKESVFVGQLYKKDVSGKNGMSIPVPHHLPKWLVILNETLVGIPSKDDVGTHSVSVQIQKGRVMRELEISVQEDYENPCGEFRTTWVEAVFDRSMDMTEKVQSLMSVSQLLVVDTAILRMYDYKYSRQIRQVENLDDGADEEEEEPQLVIIKPSCDGDTEALEIAADDMDKLLDNEETDGFSVTMLQGKVKSRKNRKQGDEVISGLSLSTDSPDEEDFFTTTIRTTSQRTTRHALDNSPVLLNPMKEFTCTSGVYCEALVHENTFKDVEDGDTYKLQLSVTVMNGKDEWLFFENKKLQGVPLSTGDFQFRLDARDKKGQMVSAPFSVTIRPPPSLNHLVTMELDLTQSRDLEKDAQLRASFVKQLAKVTRSPQDAVVIRDISKKNGKTIVQWNNGSLPYKTCSDSGIESMRQTMFTAKRKTINRHFERSMTDRFNVRNGNLELTGNCIKEDSDSSTVVPAVAATQESQFPWIILLAVLTLLVIFAAVLVVCCAKNKKKKEKPSEYTGKGLPVVFPQEVSDEQDMDHATTPMLTKEERPPLKVSHHDNPLYKPPPPLATNSPRVGAVSHANPNQKMPPPYVPP